jgi:hypothetical protein
VAALKESADSDRELFATIFAFEQALACGSAIESVMFSDHSTVRADNTVVPANVLKELSGLFFGLELCFG